MFPDENDVPPIPTRSPLPPGVELVPETVIDGGMCLDKYHIEEPTPKQKRFIETLPVQYKY